MEPKRHRICVGRKFQSQARDGRGTVREGAGVGRAIDIEWLGRAAAVFALVSYVTGLLTVNAYLNGVGASDFALVRPRYIFTGAVVILMQVTLIVVAGVGLAALHWLLKWAFQSGVVNTLLTVVLVLTLTGFVLLGFVFVVAIWRGLLSGEVAYAYGNTSVDYGVVTRAILAVSVLACSLVVVAKPGSLTPRLLKRKSVSLGIFGEVALGTVERAVALAALTCLFVTGALAFGIVLYDDLPEQFGEGRPRLVFISISSDAADIAADMALRPVGGTTLFGPLSLYWEGEEAFYVGYRDTLGVRFITRINKDVVTAMVYPDQRYDPYDSNFNRNQATPSAIATPVPATPAALTGGSVSASRPSTAGRKIWQYRWNGIQMTRYPLLAHRPSKRLQSTPQPTLTAFPGNHLPAGLRSGQGPRIVARRGIPPAVELRKEPGLRPAHREPDIPSLFPYV